MTLAAVIGIEFPLYLLARLSGYSDVETLTSLGDDFVLDRVAASTRVARYRFHDEATHAELYGALSLPERAMWHRRTGELVEQLHADDLDAHAAFLALQFRAAADDGDAGKAIEYALRAAAVAQRQGDHGTAARQFEDALECLAAPQSGDDALRWQAWIGLAEALASADARDHAAYAAGQALVVARRLGDPECFARSALAVAGRPQPFRSVTSDAAVIGLLEEALTRLARRDDALRARLLARLAEELTFALERTDRAREIARTALDLARAQDDCGILAYVLRATHWALWSPSEAAPRHALATEILTHNAAAPMPSATLELDAHLLRAWALIEMGDAHAARAELDGCARLTTRTSDPYPRWLVATTRVCLAFMTAGLDAVPELSAQAYRLGCDGFGPNAILFYGIQTTYLAWLQGDMSLAEMHLRSISDTNRLLELPVRAALASTYAEAGRTDEARIEVEGIAASGFAALPRNLTWLPSMAFLAEACARLGDAARACELYNLLAGHARCNVLLVPAVSFGSVHHFLGLLAATANRPDEAEAHFRDAARRHVAMGARHMLGRTRLAQATLLLARARGTDRETARTMLGEALAIATALGMQAVAARAAQLARAHGLEVSGGPGAAPSRESEPGVVELPAPNDGVKQIFLRRSGTMFTIESDGDPPCHFPGTGGIRYLAQLLQRPRWSVSALQLEQLAKGVDPDSVDDDQQTGLARTGGAPPQPIADSTTVRQVRRLVARLRKHREQAVEDGDHTRASSLEEDIDRYMKHLQEMRSPIGKQRSFGGDGELARQRVRQAIKRFYDRLVTQRPDLVRHLLRSVKTGHALCYDPGDRPDVVWVVILDAPRRPRGGRG